MKKAAMIFLIACSMRFLSCSGERPTTVAVGPGLSFSFSGSGRLASFTVYGPRSGQRIALPDLDVASVIWQIKTSKGYFNGARVQDFQLKYGKIPDGYTAVAPSQSQPPPPLAPGAVYSFLAETTDAPIAEGYFFMDGPEPIQTTIPDACLMLANGHEVRVNCTTKQPYQEPTDLEEMVRKNRITE
jgi:hypothetical protein